MTFSKWLRQNWPLSSFTSHQGPKYASLNQTLHLKATPNNTQASLACAPTKIHRGPGQSLANYLQDGQRVFSPDLLLRPQDGQKFASVSTASKNNGKPWRAETRQVVQEEKEGDQAKRLLRDLESRGLDSTLRHWIPFRIACKIKKTTLEIAK